MDIQEAREAFERRQAKAVNMSYEQLKSLIDQYEAATGKRYGVKSVNAQEWSVWLEAWQAAKANAVPEGFVLVPREMPKSFDEGLYVYSNSISIVDECSDCFIPMSDINHAEVWKLVIEAQEPAND